MKMTPLSTIFKKNKERTTVGLDIGSSNIKMVKLLIAKDRVELQDFFIESANMKIEEIAKRVGHDKHYINIAVSGQAAMLRYVLFPKMQEAELRKAIKFEAQKHIPFPMAEVNIDGCILKSDMPDGKMLVLLAAVKKEFINQRLRWIEDSGLRVNLVDTDSLALINAFNFNLQETYKDKAVSLLNIGSSYSNLNIIDAKIPRLSRDIGVGGKYLLQKIADALALDLRAADELIRNQQTAPETAVKITEAVALGLGNLVNEIRVSFDYFESQSASNIVKIFLSGSASQLTGLKESLGKMMNIEVEYWDPLERIVFSANLDSKKVKAAAVQLAVAAGLALRG